MLCLRSASVIGAGFLAGASAAVTAGSDPNPTFDINRLPPQPQATISQTSALAEVRPGFVLTNLHAVAPNHRSAAGAKRPREAPQGELANTYLRLVLKAESGSLVSRLFMQINPKINTQSMKRDAVVPRAEQSLDDHGEAALVHRPRQQTDLARSLERPTASTRTYDNIVTQDNARAHYGDNHYGDQYHHHYARPGDESEIISAEDDPLKLLLESLSFPQKNYRLAVIEPAYRQTCQWLFATPEYTRWRDWDLREIHHRILWLKGNPGAGKSTITKCALEYANAHNPEERNIHFFFNARGDRLERCNEGMYRSLLHQVAQDVPWLLEMVDAEAAASYAETGWPIDLLRSLFREAAQKLASSVHLNCYIDAVDEGEDEDQIRDLVAFFEDLSETAVSKNIRFSVYFASRHYPHVSIRRSESIILDDYEGHHRDIASYVRNKLVCRHSRLREELVTDIMSGSSGVFLWVVLVVRILNTESDRGNPHRLSTALQAIPKGLDDLFNNIIGSGDKDGTLLRTLLWVMFAKRSVSPVELYFAVVSSATFDLPTSIVWNHEAVDETSVESFIVSSSRGLLQVASPGGYHPGYAWESIFTQSERVHKHRVQFIHESVREYLMTSGIKRLDPIMSTDLTARGNLSLALCCERYLELSIQSLYIPSSEEMDTYDTRLAYQHMLTDLPFLPYALAHILHHSEEAASHGLNVSIPFEDCLYAFSPLLILCHTNPDRPARICQTSLHILTMTGCASLVRRSLDRCPEDAQQSYISSRVHGGAKHGKSALELAVDVNRLDIVRILLEYGADVHARATLNNPILMYAASHGTIEMVQEMLKHGADANASDKIGQTTLHKATMLKNLELIELLLHNNADVNASDHIGETALHIAVLYDNNLDVIRLLLCNNADANARARWRDTPFLISAKSRRVETVEEMLRHGANVNTRDGTGTTALRHAVGWGSVEMTRTLLTHGADAYIEGDSGESIVNVARGKNDLVIIQLLTFFADVPAYARLEAARALEDEEWWKGYMSRATQQKLWMEYGRRATHQICRSESEDENESDRSSESLEIAVHGSGIWDWR